MTHISRNRALLMGFTAYLMWGVFPPFFAMLKPATPLEILGHRIVWSFLLVLLMLVALRSRWTWLRAGVFTRKAFPRLLLAAGLIAVNWLTYIWAVNNGHVVEASVGYFINPLVSLLLGVLVFGERLGTGGRIGGLLAFLGVLVISWGHWGTLWISLMLAFSFAFYGVAKKRAHLTGLQGLLVESGLLFLPALGYLGWLAATGQGTFGVGVTHSLLLSVAGIVTVLPLWLFAIAAPRVPLGVMGILQYVAPTMQFLFGILLFAERVELSYWIGLVGIWIGSAVYLAFNLRASADRADAPAPVR